MKLKLIFLSIIMLASFSCGESKISSHPNKAVLNNNYKSDVNISDVLRTLKESKFRDREFLFFSEENLSDWALKKFSFNVHNDTVFVKVESEWLSDIVGDDRDNLVVWNGENLVYVSNKPTREIIDTVGLKTRILNLKHEFINLVEEWDTVALRSKENNLFCSNRFHSYLYRIIFSPKQITVDTFRFWDLSIPFENENGELFMDANYNTLYEFTYSIRSKLH